MADWGTIKANLNTNLPDSDVINAIIEEKTGTDVLYATGSQVLTGSVKITGSVEFYRGSAAGATNTVGLRIVGPASASVSGNTKNVGTGSHAALIFSGSHVRPSNTSGGQVGEWRFFAPYLFVCTGSVTGNFLVFTGSQV